MAEPEYIQNVVGQIAVTQAAATGVQPWPDRHRDADLEEILGGGDAILRTPPPQMNELYGRAIASVRARAACNVAGTGIPPDQVVKVAVRHGNEFH